MTLKLHVLGPAFGLPSVDAECTAAIVLLTLRYGNDQALWTVTACHTSPATLPLLIDGDTRINGFSNICHHLRSGSFDADSVATIALLQAHGPLLIAAHLYLSYENYSTTTRPAFTPILPLYARFLIPSSLRSSAKERTKQLGIGSLDIEALDDKHASSEQKLGAAESTFEASAKDRASLLLPKIKTVRSLLAQKPESLAAFKLQDLADALLQPLQDLLGERRFFADDNEPGEVDCLAYAYLGLMLKPDVPQPWLPNIIKRHYHGLVDYFQRVESHLGLEKANTALPWMTPTNFSLQGMLTDLFGAIEHQTSIAGLVRYTHREQHSLLSMVTTSSCDSLDSRVSIVGGCFLGSIPYAHHTSW